MYQMAPVKALLHSGSGLTFVTKVLANKLKPTREVIHESPDEFIHHLVEGEETNFRMKT